MSYKDCFCFGGQITRPSPSLHAISVRAFTDASTALLPPRPTFLPEHLTLSWLQLLGSGRVVGAGGDPWKVLLLWTSWGSLRVNQTAGDPGIS